jgi:hypothetical protein
LYDLLEAIKTQAKKSHEKRLKDLILKEDMRLEMETLVREEKRKEGGREGGREESDASTTSHPTA